MLTWQSEWTYKKANRQTLLLQNELFLQISIYGSSLLLLKEAKEIFRLAHFLVN